MATILLPTTIVSWLDFDHCLLIVQDFRTTTIVSILHSAIRTILLIFFLKKHIILLVRALQGVVSLQGPLGSTSSHHPGTSEANVSAVWPPGLFNKTVKHLPQVFFTFYPLCLKFFSSRHEHDPFPHSLSYLFV